MQEWLDAVPITVLFFGSALVALAVFECGYRVGHWVQDRTPEEKEGPTAMLVGSLLALQAFLLAIGMVGYNAGLTRRRSPLAATVMILVLAAVITLLIDLDRPREGLLTINQQPLIDLAQQIQAVRSNDSGM